LIDREIKGGAFPRRRVEPDPAAVTLDDLAHEGQADAGSLLVVVFGVEPLEYPEDIFVKFLGDADTIVPDVKHIGFKSARSRQGREIADLDAFHVVVVVFRRVDDEVAEHFGDARLVTRDLRQRPRNDDRYVALLERRLAHHFDISDDRVEVGRLDRQCLAAEARKI
jgi:hypothetical protein